VIVEVAVNLGNYQNMSVRSSEHDTAKECFTEILGALRSVGEPQTDDFCTKYLILAATA